MHVTGMYAYSTCLLQVGGGWRPFTIFPVSGPQKNEGENRTSQHPPGGRGGGGQECETTTEVQISVIGQHVVERERGSLGTGLPHPPDYRQF